ncbi:hypothetical protein BSP36_082 [Bacillus phage BSP36]|uniref:Tail assembly chaperone n=1 Tax=Bacillus phage BSP38 TaxID=2283013 RepID=A0A345MJU5_BPBSP|nr:tail assembly chaperone [Bacillus phage BSP38]AXH71127.1 hypothetical protein BSP38_085 [Bacillus phage BSP38]AYJ75169.1 hypothetical protein BSP36_082 [Bacillus phage BSP36]
MKTFNVLPTNKDFRQLSDDQINLMLFSLEEDAREIELARKGLTVDSEHFDTDFEEEVWNKAPGEWEVLREGHDPDDIARQVAELTREEDLRNLANRFDGVEEYNKYIEETGKTARQTEIEQYIDNQIAAAEEKARKLEAVGKKQFIDDKDRPEIANNTALSDQSVDLDKEAIDKSIALFNSVDDDDDDGFAPLI